MKKIFKWFKGKKSKGGSQILEYDTEGKDLIGFQEDFDVKLREEREKVFDELFGHSESVSHEIMPLVPHIDVYIYEPGYQGRDFYTLVSSGMSDMPMNTPEGVDDRFSRAEIVMYVKEPKDTYINLIRHYARYPHKYETYFAFDHTIPNGQPAEPYFENSSLDSIMFIPSIVKPDGSFTELLKSSTGIEVQLLHMTFLTSAECDLKLEKGSDVIYDLLDEMNHSFICDEQRPSYVTP